MHLLYIIRLVARTQVATTRWKSPDHWNT